MEQLMLNVCEDRRVWMCGVIEGRKWIDERALFVIYYQEQMKHTWNNMGCFAVLKLLVVWWYIYNTGEYIGMYIIFFYFGVGAC